MAAEGGSKLAMQWYVLRVASNKEEQVREALSRKMEVEGIDSVGRIIVPVEQVKRIRRKAAGAQAKALSWICFHGDGAPGRRTHTR